MTLAERTPTAPPLTGELFHGPYRIVIQDTGIAYGSSNICYSVRVYTGDSDTIGRPMILKEFYPLNKVNEEYGIYRDEKQQLHFFFSRDGKEPDVREEVRKRREAVKRAYALQQKLAAVNQTMGIVVYPVAAWGDEEQLTYYTLHRADWGKSLEQEPPTDLREILRVMYSAADSVARMNAQGYVHGDLKPENLLWLDRGTASSHVALFDFDCSFQYINADYSNIPTRGTDKYTAPELRHKRIIGPLEMAGIYLPTLDVYSLGVILFRLLFHRFPTPEEENSATEQAIYQVLSQKLEHDPTWRAKLLSEQQKQLAEVQTACDAMQRGENAAWNALQKPIFQSNTLASLFDALKAEICFVHEYNRYHDFKQSDEDILNAAPVIFGNS